MVINNAAAAERIGVLSRHLGQASLDGGVERAATTAAPGAPSGRVPGSPNAGQFAQKSSSVWDVVPQAPPDPILGKGGAG